MSISVHQTWKGFDYSLWGLQPHRNPPERDDWTIEDESWTPDEKTRYLDQACTTQGFDVDRFPFTCLAVIEPWENNDKDRYINFQSAAKMAIKAYNHEYKDRKGGELQFVKVVKCMRQFDGYGRYFLTFDARDLSNNLVQTYQAVLFRAPKIKLHVQSFRLKPPSFDGKEEGGARDNQENWFWRGHIFDPYPFAVDFWH